MIQPTDGRMTPKRRFLSGVLGGRVDRPPVASVTSVTNVEQMEQMEAYFPDVHLDGTLMARLAAGAYEILGYDAIMPYFSVQAEAAALGCVVDWGSRTSMPVEHSHPWSDPEQVCLPTDFLQRPSTKAVCDALRILRREYGYQVAIVGKVMGPWTLSYHLHGIHDFLLETLTEPDKVRRFLEKLKGISVHFAHAQIEAGADVICLADHATGDLVSPGMYRDFLLPIHQELTERIGCPMVLHICGDTLDRLGHICTSGFDCFHFDSKVHAREAVQTVAGRISLMGNINNPETLLHGSVEQVAAEACQAVEAGVQIVGPECAVALETPSRNLGAILETVQSQI